MKQCSWVYVDDYGHRYKVGMFHSVRKGYFMVHINKRVSIIDYNVFKTTSYPIFLGEQLFHLRITRHEDRFVYTFEMDKEADTPHNKRRKQRNKSDLRKTVLAIGGFMLLVLLFAGGFSTCQRKMNERLTAKAIAAGSAFTAGIVNDDPNPRRIHYYYYVDGKEYRKAMLLPKGEVVLAEGLPVRSGNEFMVEYALSDPGKSIVRLDMPSEEQLVAYWKFILPIVKEYNPHLSEEAVNCQLFNSYDKFGLHAWGLMYNQQRQETKERPGYNARTYMRWRNSDRVRSVIDSCELK